MDLLERFIADMRAKCRARGDVAPLNVAHNIMHFHDVTNNAFNINYNIVKPAPNAGETRGKYTQLNGCLDARLIISQRREYQGTRTRFNRVMAGVVIKLPEWKILSIMPEFPQAEVDLKYIRENYGDYMVFPCRDGTTATLYYDNGAWRVSTYNGIDVSDHTWLGKSTYIEAIRELCAAHAAFDWDKLQKTRAYTILFHHPDFHPFSAEKPNIELVQSVDLTNLGKGISLTDNIGIPNLPSCDITIEQILEKRDSSITDFRKDNENRCYGYVLRHRSTIINPNIAAALAANPLLASAAASAAPTPTPDNTRGSSSSRGNNRGRGGARGGARGGGNQSARADASARADTVARADTYASRADSSARVDVSARATTHDQPQWLGLSHDAHACDYIIESRLMLFIRRTIYDLPRGTTAAIQLNTPAERIDYYCLRAMLGKPDICTVFMGLFPQYKPRYDEFNALLQTIRNKLIAAIGCNGGDTAMGRPKGFDSISVIAASLYDGLVQHKLNINSSQTASIIDDYIRNTDNLHMFHAYYQSMR